MNKTEKLAQKLNQAILQSPEFQAYQSSLKSLEKHSEIFKLEDELKEMQKDLMKKRTNQNEDTTQLMKDYQIKKEMFENHPLVANYLFDKENVADLCLFVKEAIEGQLD